MAVPTLEAVVQGCYENYIRYTFIDKMLNVDVFQENT